MDKDTHKNEVQATKTGRLKECPKCPRIRTLDPYCGLCVDCMKNLDIKSDSDYV